MKPKLKQGNPCALCGEDKELRLSHIIPKSIGKRFKASSSTGYIRTTDDINATQQDVVKDYMLCEDCEKLLNAFETPFINEVYDAHHNDINHTFDCTFEYWRFVTSVVWRVLKWYQLRMRSGDRSGGFTHLPIKHQLRVKQALKIWGDFILCKRDDVGQFPVHLILTGLVESASGPVPHGLNEFFMSTISYDLVSDHEKESLMIIAIPGFIMLGFIGKHNDWDKPLAVDLVIDGNISIPGVLVHYIENRMRKIEEAWQGVSERQSEVIQARIDSNPERVHSSNSGKAREADKILTETNPRLSEVFPERRKRRR